jgi:hypothetical protein
MCENYIVTFFTPFNSTGKFYKIKTNWVDVILSKVFLSSHALWHCGILGLDRNKGRLKIKYAFEKVGW